MNMVWDVDCVAREVLITLNGEAKGVWKFYNSAETVERISFRTGRAFPSPRLEEDREFLPPDDLPDCGEPLKQESVYYLFSFSTEDLPEKNG